MLALKSMPCTESLGEDLQNRTTLQVQKLYTFEASLIRAPPFWWLFCQQVGVAHGTEVVKHSPPQSTSEGAPWPQTHRKRRPYWHSYDQVSKANLLATQVKLKLIYSRGLKKTKATIPDSKSTCLSERNLGLFTYPNIISIDVSAQESSDIFGLKHTLLRI